MPYCCRLAKGAAGQHICSFSFSAQEMPTDFFVAESSIIQQVEFLWIFCEPLGMLRTWTYCI